jgi:hypothetical protein
VLLALLARVLFIGNSLTSVNNVPALVAQLASATGQPFEYRAVTFDGYSLQDHWNRGDAVRAIGEGKWTFVVLQQGPSALPASQSLLREFVRRFDREIRRAGARTALYMVWPSSERQSDFEGVHSSYAGAAREVGATLLPAGDAWREAWRRDAGLRLYGSDGFHPTLAGSYLAALVIYQGVFDRPASGLPPLGLPAGEARLLQEAAAALYDSSPKNAATGGGTLGGSDRVSAAPGRGPRIAAKNSIAASTLRCSTSSSGSSDQFPGSCRLPTMIPSRREFIVALVPSLARPEAR